MSLKKEIEHLLEEGVIDELTASKIKEHYKSNSSGNRIVAAFAVLGATLVGLGIMLILAHNWDQIPRLAKSFIAFIPLLVGQGLCAYVLLKKRDNSVWKEGSASFLFFAIGSSIALIGQIYNLPSDIESFLLTWALLSLPLIYLFKSNSVSLLFISLISYYATQMGYWNYPSSPPYYYWLLMLLILPHYYRQFREYPKSNYSLFHHWLIPISLLITLGSLSGNKEELMIVSFSSLCGLFYIIGTSTYFKENSLRSNPYRLIGSLGIMTVLLITSFNWFWTELSNENYHFEELMVAREFWTAFIISALAMIGSLRLYLSQSISTENKLLGSVYLVFILLFFLGLKSSMVYVMVNLLILALAIVLIRKGAKEDHLGILNYAMLSITALIVCRFFDSNLSFELRGLIFIVVGFGFFLGNYWIIKKRKSNAV